jgi:UDP-N-acetylmuramyl pentapeptide phosphotransferase/UDP-N-acetylglucosamine-1-phosphate transferase
MYAVISFSLAGSLIGFLLYNFSPAKIFMGDTGSLLIGLVNAILVIKFINIAPTVTARFPMEAAPAVGFSILFVPLFDTLRVFGLRILNRRSPFSPDRNHVHHLLLDLGLSQRSVTMLCVGINICFIALAYFMRQQGTTIVMATLFGLAISLFGILYYKRTRKKTAVKSGRVISMEGKILKSHKILSPASEVAKAD